MKHVYTLEDAALKKPSLVSIGVFDGVHLGHQALIRRLVDEAHSTGRLAVVLTFFPHPVVVIRGVEGRHYLTSAEARAKLIGEMGVDCVVTHPFDEQVRQIRAANFVDRLLEYLKMESIWVGVDFALGYKREGNVDFLRAYGAEKGFTVETVDLVAHEADGTTISSSHIRDLLAKGQVDRVRNWLGRGYTVSGTVAHGDKRGQTIGFPTANLVVWEMQVIPANGVYAGWATVNGERYMAVTNVGVRPTFDGQSVTVEAHLLDFDRDIYGQTLHLTFETRLRAEMKFGSIEALIKQIQADVAAGRAFLTAQKTT